MVLHASQVNDKVIPWLPSDRSSAEWWTGRRLRDWCVIKLRLQPVGAMWDILPRPELRRFAAELLQVLQQVHRHGFVHRDVRDANVVRAGRWLLIDFELAAPIGTPAPANHGYLPRGVMPNSAWTPAMDLSMLGSTLLKLLDAPFCPGGRAVAYADELSRGQYSTAADATAALPSQEDWDAET